ncbi:MAG: ABC-F family ATP-binding cassette domain-containing protein [Chloroflexi bacterium]|uniref:ribosomal protection-like ABC-F family protein n=1 Tax=Candidatus Flexifilum breve TaxID=3140694 RepID=UPI003134B365|nr:ABC-F family ATP-binding cassette domain-containing protein [Chloroflexota bacterium]
MHIIHVNNITVNYDGRVIFKDLSWVIDSQDRVGLIGHNGAGKSSLLKVIAGLYQPDAGAMVKQRGVSVGYLPQHVTLTPGRTLIEEAMILPPKLAEVDAALHAVEHKLTDPAVYNDADALTRALGEQEKLVEQFEALGGSAHAGRIRSILAHLGIKPDAYDLPAETLSGGQKKLVQFTRLAAEQPDVLLLDEPDNHLDLDAKRRLEGFLRDYPGAVVIVSHDRYLLDELVKQIVEMEQGKLTAYKGNYSQYALLREQARLRQQQMYVAQQKRVAQVEAAIKRFELAAAADLNERHARQARSRRKMLERWEESGELVDKVRERRQLELDFAGSRGSTKALEVKKLSMAFDDDPIFLDLDLLVRHGERVGLVGKNGSGKSVLFKLILGELAPLDGEIKIGNSSKLGYYAQEHQTLFSWYERTPIEFIRDASPSSEGAAVAFLLNFQFTYEQTRQPIGTLSGGERSRLQLGALMLQRPNLLLLDEPTNNLDIQSSEALETALEDFEGALFVISHDRYFLDRVVDRVVELDDGALTSFEGGYTDFLEGKARKAQKERERLNAKAQGRKGTK